MQTIFNFIKPRLLLLIFLIVGIFGACVGIIWMFIALIVSPNGSRAKNIALGFDRLGNSITGGNGQETISSRAGRLQAAGGWPCYLCKILDWLQKDHCKDSIGT